jgi:molybdate transport system regulatory protein
MNTLQGIITEIISEEHLYLSGVKVEVCNNILSAIVVDTPSTAPYLIIGSKINVLFRENEVAIAKEYSGQISLQNKFDCEINAIETGKLLSKVSMTFCGYNIVSLITANAAHQMRLSVGDHVTAMVKTNEISLSPI